MTRIRAWLADRRQLPMATRLALALGVLALVVFGLVGAVTVTSMRQYLVKRLDEQLTEVQAEEWREVQVGAGVRQVPKDWMAVVVDIGADGVLTTAEQGGRASSTVRGLDDLVRTASRSRSPARATLHGEFDDAPEYRAVARTVAPGEVVVTAAPQSELDKTVTRLAAVEAITFLAALLVLVGTGAVVLRRGLRPLGAIAATAHDIASTDLTGTSARVGLRATGRAGGVEVNELRNAFNVMLAHIDSSLAARQEAEQRLRRFVADASHELRTPLTSIRGYADLFRYAAANAPEEREAHLAKMREEAARMSLLLDDLLLLARLDAAEPGTEPPLRIERVDLTELAGVAADAFRVARPGHPLVVDLPDDPVPLDADPMRLRQVLDNLLTNAAVHTPEGTEVRVGVRLEPGWVVAEVSDTGPGIPAADQLRIFDRFYRVDDSRTRAVGGTGTGLGLSVVRSLVGAHGGSVTVASRPGRTTFTVRLPSPVR